MEKVTVTFTVDRAALNERCGNTPNVTAPDALAELLGELFNGAGYYCEHCGRAGFDAETMPGGFEIVGAA